MTAAGELGDGSGGAEERRRIREAEERLLEAIEELQRRQRVATRTHAVGNLCQSFLFSYGVLVVIGILLRAFKLARLRSYTSLLHLKLLVSEKDLIGREEACGIGLLFGGFTGSYLGLRCFLRKFRKKEVPSNAVCPS